MRHLSKAALGAAVCVAAAASAQAAPVAVLTIPYSIGTLSQALQIMGDGSVRLCDGSVRICDGSVIPVPNALAAVAGDGSVRLATPITLLGDGSVRVGDGSVRLGDGSVAPAPNTDNLGSILLGSLTGSPNPLLSASLSVLDAGSPTAFTVSFFIPLNLGGASDYSFLLDGEATLSDGGRDGVTLSPGTVGSTTAVAFGLVDGNTVAATGGSLSGAAISPLPAVSGTGSCVACGGLGLVMSFTGSGGGDSYALSATFDVNPIGVPAPAPLGLLAVGLLGLAAVGRRR